MKYVAVDEKWWHRRVALIVLVVATVFIVTYTAYTFSRAFAGYSEFEQRAMSTVGMTRLESIEIMGEPIRILTGDDYSAERKAIGEVYAPNPPAVEADFVLRFGYMNSMALIYIENDMVTEVYVGAT